MTAIARDLRYGLRLLLRSPGFALAAIVALGLGIGANTAIFSVVHAVLLRPLPFEEPESLVALWESNKARKMERGHVARANFLEWRKQSGVLEAAAVYHTQMNLSGGPGEPEEVQAECVSAGLFRLLGVRPILGRWFAEEEDRPGDNVAMISHRLWKRRFGGDPQVIGGSIRLNGHASRVLGVLPPEYQLLDQRTDVWTPLGLGPGGAAGAPAARDLAVIGRLREGVGVEQARAEMAVLAARLEREAPELNSGTRINLLPLHEELVGDVRRPLLVLSAAVGCLLLIACANVANLLLARGAARQREVAVRTALGAGRARVIRQLLTESVLLACAGGALGLALSVAGLRLLIAAGPRDMPRLPQAHLDPVVLLFTAAVSVGTGLLFGLAPAWQVSASNVSEALKEGGRTRGVQPGRRRLRSLLVAGEVALVAMLLVEAGLMARSFQRLRAVDPGFPTPNLLTMRLRYTRGGPVESQHFFEEAAARVAALPAVQATGMVSFLPFDGFGSGVMFTVEGRPMLQGEKPVALVRFVDRHYFRTLGLPLLAGRTFTAHDGRDAPPVVVVDQALATQLRLEGSAGAVGSRLRLEYSSRPLIAEVTGVVGKLRAGGLTGEPWPTIYCHYPQAPTRSMTLVARTRIEPRAMIRPIAAEIHRLNPEQPVAEVRTMEEVLAESVSSYRFNTLLLAVFAAAALALATVGVYGVMAYNVSERTQEIGVRLALGAQHGDVLRLVVGKGLALTAAGLALGLVGAAGASRLMVTLLYGVSTTDWVSFSGVAGLVLAVATLACYLPARRALKTPPVVALRQE